MYNIDNQINFYETMIIEEGGELIGVFDLSDIGIANEDGIGKFKFKKAGILQVYVYPNDGDNIPHMHVFNNESGNKHVDFCIRIDTNELFIHGIHNKLPNGGNVTSKKFNKAFMEFMKIKDENGTTNWKTAKTIWNNSYDATKISINKIPDYLNMQYGNNDNQK